MPCHSFQYLRAVNGRHRCFIFETSGYEGGIMLEDNVADRMARQCVSTEKRVKPKLRVCCPVHSHGLCCVLMCSSIRPQCSVIGWILTTVAKSPSMKSQSSRLSSLLRRDV